MPIPNFGVSTTILNPVDIFCWCYKSCYNLGCQLDSKLSGKSLTSKVLRKINAKLKFLYRESIYLIPAFRRLLCNVLIQAHFNCGCSSWFPLLKKNLKIKLQKVENKYIRFCLNLHSRSRVDPLHLRNRNLHPARDRVEHCIVNTVLSTRIELYQNIHEMFKPAFLKYSIKPLVSSDIPLWKANTGQKKVILLWVKNMVKNKP